MARQEESLSRKLYSWAVDDMHYHPRRAGDKPLSSADMQILCRGHNADIWRYVIANVHSAQTVKKIRGNLALRHRRETHDVPSAAQRQAQSTQRTQLEDQRLLLQKELSKLQSDISHVDKDLGRLEDDLAHTDCAWTDAANDYHDTLRKTALLRMYSLMCGERIAQNEELANRFKAKLLHHTYKKRVDSDNETYVSRETRGHCLVSDIETTCCRDVRMTCESIERFTHSVLESTLNQSEVRAEKEHVWAEVEHVLNIYAVQDVIHSLITNCQHSTALLRDQTDHICIAADAQRLRFKYEGGGSLKDMSHPPTILQSVRDLLETSQALHVKKFFETEKNRNQAYKLEEKIEACRVKIGRALAAMRQPGERDLSRTLIDKSLELAEESSALNAINEETERLRLAVREMCQAHEKLLMKHQQIVDFRHLANKKQNLIHVLARHNSKSPSRLEGQKLEIDQYIASNLMSYDTLTDTLISQQNGEVLKEVETFVKVSLPYLLYTAINGDQKLQTHELSIHHDDRADHKSTASHVFSKISRLLDVPYYQGVECVFAACIKLMCDITDCQQLVKHDESKKAALSHATDHVMTDAQIKELCLRVNGHVQKQLDEILPLLNGCVNKTTNFVTFCLSVSQSVKHWWEQPGQYCVPWVKVADETLCQWLNKWTVLATQIRQLQASQISKSRDATKN